MYVAQIHRKLSRTEERMEDLLTSNVFGLWRYLSYDLGLTQFPNTSTNLDGDRLQLPELLVETELEFWPWLHEVDTKGSEPDVLIKVTGEDGSRHLLLIESKYHSGKSSGADEEILPNDQLAREMQNLRQIAKRQAFDSYALVYVTADALIPRGDLEESIEELGRKTGMPSREQFFWTTWLQMPQILQQVTQFAREPIEKKMLEDLRMILDGLELSFFQGIRVEGWKSRNFEWRFERIGTGYDWTSMEFPEWGFRGPITRFNWDSESTPQWAFHWD